MVFSSQARNVMFAKVFIAKSPSGMVRGIGVKVAYDERGEYPLTEMQLSLDTNTRKFASIIKNHQELNNVRRLDIKMTKQVEKILMRNDNRMAA